MVCKRNQIEKNIEKVRKTLSSIYEPSYNIDDFYKILMSIDNIDALVQKHKELDEVRKNDRPS